MPFLQFSLSTKIILCIQSVCMLLGAYSHIVWVARHGFLYPGISLYSNLFWDSLIFLDPLAALLLFISPRKGVLLVAIIIVADVIHNAFIGNTLLSFSTTVLGQWLTDNLNFVLQVIFCVFVLGVLGRNLRETRAIR